MIPPIYVYEPNDLDVFESVEFAERYLEPWNVNDNIYFDSFGRVLEAVVVKDERGIDRCVIREQAGGSELKPERLKKLIVEFLAYLGEIRADCTYDRETLSRMSLRQLVTESIKFKSV